MARDTFHIETTVLPQGQKRDLWIAAGRFVEGPLEAPTIHAGGYAIPGLVDAHAHLALASPPAIGDDEARARASARAHLEAGVLAVREPGSPNRASSLIGPGDDLPTVITAGRFITAPGCYFPGLAREVVDDQLPSAALEELAHSGGWVKVIGDFFDDSGVFSTNFGTEALIETARLVHGAGGRITMHTMIPESLQQAIDAGFDGIEHGSVHAAGQIEGLAGSRITWTPTALIDEILIRTANDMLGPAQGPVLAEALGSHGEAIRSAHELGVRILAGTDAGMNPHGVVAEEIRLLHAIGLSPGAALAAGSWEARSYLGLPGIEVGAPADLVIFPEDPTRDLSVLEHPQIILLHGRPIAGPDRV